MPKCVIKKCRNNTLTTKKQDGVTYHRFPVHEIMREKWRKLVARERCEELYKPNKSSVICSDHFLEYDLYCTTKGFNRLKKTAVPHIEFVDDSGTNQSRKSLAESSEQPKPSHLLFVDDSGTNQSRKSLAESSEQPKPSHLLFVDDSGTNQSRKSLAESSEQPKPSHLLKSTAAEQKQTVLSPGIINSPVHKSILSSPSGLDSMLNTPKTTNFKKELTKCYRKLRFKNRQVRNLKKQIKRLIKANLSLKEIVHILKTKRSIDDSHSNVKKSDCQQ